MPTSIPSPYKDSDDLRAVQSLIGKADYNYLFHQILPFRGSQRAVIATLLKQLVRACRACDLEPFDLENETHLNAILTTTTFDLSGISPTPRAHK